MRTSRKTKTMVMSERTPSRSPVGAGTSRHLCKKDLGSVIFGCKSETIKECLEKQLFGLPSSHFQYVRNIEPGLPLFLFNYSDRRMHGIYVAASDGQMNIDPYAWTNGGTEKTSFPAQVRILVSMQCMPLLENQFKKAVGENYYMHNHFYFELDHAQTKGLMSLFEPSPVRNFVKQAPVVTAKTQSLSPIPPSKSIPVGNQETSHPIGVEMKEPKPSTDSRSMDTSESLAWGDGYLEVGRLSKTSRSALGGENSDSQNVDMEGVTQDNYSRSEELENDIERVLCILQRLSAEGSGLPSKIRKDDKVVPCVPQESCKEDTLSTESLVSTEVVEKATVPSMQGNEELLQIIGELTQRSLVLEKNQATRDQEMHELKNVVKESGRTVRQLQDRVVELESKLHSSISLDGGEPINVYLESRKLIYLIGGYDGSSWLSSLHSFLPSEEKLTPLKAMSSPRSYASAVALDNNIFVFGGGTGEAWCSTVECYSPRNNDWTLCPPLTRAKGSFGGASLNNKIYAVGGGDEFGPLSEVEMFDPILGKWINTNSLIRKRFATAAVELDGALYAVGGYDGNNYLMSAERYDPREGYWRKISNMNLRRGCLSLAVLNEKIYTMGGFDGDKMVASVEVFDLRGGSWTFSEPMNICRGYAACAVLDDNLFTIGGLRNSEDIWDTVECYREGMGWSIIPSKAIEKRCFLSAIVL